MSPVAPTGSYRGDGCDPATLRQAARLPAHLACIATSRISQATAEEILAMGGEGPTNGLCCTAMIEMTHDPIDVNRVLTAIQDPRSGGIALFVGVVRDNSSGTPVKKLEYHAYESMAIAKMRTLAETAVIEFQLRRVAIIHRLGELQVGDAAVVTAVSAPHRSEAFRACRFLIDRLKQDVPIWKKEFFADHEAWV